MGKKGSNGGKRSSKVVGSEVVKYNGPVKLSIQPHDNLITVNLSDCYFCTGNVSLGMQFSSYGSAVASAADWASYKNVYDECRIIAFTMEYLPSRIDGSIVHGPGLACVTSTGVNPGPFTSLPQLVQYNYKPVYTYKPFKMPWRMSATEEAQWSPTASTPANHGYVTAFFPGAQTTTFGAYGLQITTWLVQFRGRS
jgi:hypothetical protein